MMTRFDDIRHYTDAEMLVALKRIRRFPELKPVVAYAFPDMTYDEFANLLDSITGIADLQHRVMVRGMATVVEKTMSSFSFSGLENIKPGKAYLYISNHRDIVLDAYLLQCILDTHGLPTTRITFGSNLMKSEFLRELGLCNKMFRTERGSDKGGDFASARGFYSALEHLSDYINSSILNDNVSIWIAQRGGRTKDGHDATDPALVKMLGMAHKNRNLADNYARLNIVPVTVSYEWEPCDALKAAERCKTVDGQYRKSENEDLVSIITGIKQYKGAVHLAIGKPLVEDDLLQLPASRSEFCDSLAAILDSRINAAYRFSPNNYIAHDILFNTKQFTHRYSSSQAELFARHIAAAIEKNNTVNPEKLRRNILELYANPIINAQ